MTLTCRGWPTLKILMYRVIACGTRQYDVMILLVYELAE